MLRRLVWLLVVGLLAGCGAARSGLEVEDTRALLAAAPDAADAVGSAAFVMRMDMSSADLGTVTVQARGSMAFDPVRFAAVGTMSGAGASGSYEMRLVDGVMYMRMPQAAALLRPGVEWLAFDLEALSESSGVDVSALYSSSQSQNPTAMLELLRGAADGVTTVGEETLRGVETTHYRATVDTDAALELSGTELEGALAPALDLLPEQYEVDVWLDADGLPRRMSYELTMTPPQGAAMTQSITMEMFDYGEPVDVPAPPADVTQDALELGAAA